jgi:hypothetical protein
MEIWGFMQRIMDWLVRWNIINIGIGLILSLFGRFWRGVGSQFIGWGVINIGIALVGERVTQTRRENMENPYEPEQLAKERRNLRLTLLVNSGLDLLYILGGRRIRDNTDSSEHFKRGIGIGIMIQGALLFVWDLILLRILDHDIPEHHN